MGCKLLCIIALVFFGCGLVNARVFYVDGQSNIPPGIINYPTYPIEDPSEQASRDLDLSFSAGDPDENNKDIIYPVKKVYAYAPPERSILELNREYERPAAAYYKLSDLPTRRIIYGDQFPVTERNHKLVKLNNGPRKGELVLELRVIANNNNNGM